MEILNYTMIVLALFAIFYFIITAGFQALFRWSLKMWNQSKMKRYDPDK